MDKEELKKAAVDYACRADDCLMNDRVIPLKEVFILIDQLDEPDKSKCFEVEVDGVIHHVHEDAHTKIYDEAYAQGEVDAERRIKSDFQKEKPIQVSFKSYDKTIERFELPESLANELMEQLRGADE